MPFKTDFDAFMSECWQHHEENPEQIYAQLETALSEVKDVTQIERIFALMLHTAIGHLQCPEQFLTCLEHFDERKVAESLAFQRSIAVARYFVDGTDNMELLEEQEQRRVYALISNELSALAQLELASQWLVKAALGMTPNDAEGPLARAFAITANNLACQYEALAERTCMETSKMLEAATLALDYWKVAGGWMQEERAEYRLAMSLLKADKPQEAKVHAERCEDICQQHGSDALELFHAHDLLMQVHFHLSQKYKAKLDEEMQQHCKTSSLT
ncbi:MULTISPECIES: hypothetical protein [Vibrio]|uniref:hypothetical protein n=1 Tax=Vibrio TaxID=662 RepID=UPI001CDD3CCE|nr:MULTISPECIES: hypothetical protein [Vibrio]MCA2437444.1 hypothetical protein [Vibrio alginolyticus]MDW1729384.1 hypothetical protein [Vibrio sp. Vb2356]MDW1930038.1 hypothetical protein [Vibrio sp. 970]